MRIAFPYFREINAPLGVRHTTLVDRARSDTHTSILGPLLSERHLPRASVPIRLQPGWQTPRQFPPTGKLNSHLRTATIVQNLTVNSHTQRSIPEESAKLAARHATVREWTK